MKVRLITWKRNEENLMYVTDVKEVPYDKFYRPSSGEYTSIAQFYIKQGLKPKQYLSVEIHND